MITELLETIWEKLIISPKYNTRKLVARHSQTSQAILEELVKDPEI
jgi:hypothetical protein